MREPSGPAPKLHQAELLKLEVLKDVNLAPVLELLAGCEVRALAEGEVLLHMGQPNRQMYMVLSGRLSVHLESPASEPVASLEEGETVGELSVIEESLTSAYVVAAAPSRLLVVDEARFWQLINASHDFAINLLLLLARRLRKNNSTVSDNIRLQREYKRNATIDGLTGLYNRRWLEEALPRFINRFGRSGKALALIVADVDHFKRFNDTYGHPAGDRVLIAVASALRQNLRPSDLVARYGGEEFVVILPDTGEEGARAAGERVRLAISETAVTTAEGQPLPRVTISLGAALFSPAQTAAALVAAADAALYESKRSGRNRLSFASSAPEEGEG
jgi:diguanylate cyclase (GGDEF)-like protein